MRRSGSRHRGTVQAAGDESGDGAELQQRCRDQDRVAADLRGDRKVAGLHPVQLRLLPPRVQRAGQLLVYLAVLVIADLPGPDPVLHRLRVLQELRDGQDDERVEADAPTKCVFQMNLHVRAHLHPHSLRDRGGPIHL